MYCDIIITAASGIFNNEKKNWNKKKHFYVRIPMNNAVDGDHYFTDASRVHENPESLTNLLEQKCNHTHSRKLIKSFNSETVLKKKMPINSARDEIVTYSSTRNNAVQRQNK